MTPDANAAPPDTEALSDQDLMLLVARGLVQEPAAELFDRHNRALYNFLAWLCNGNLAEAEDLTQKTWLKLISRCGDYRPGAATFRTYLFQIARNAFLDARRSAGERLRDDAAASDADDRREREDQDPGPEVLLLSGEAKTRLHTALMTLPASQREVVVLRYFAELSLEEVAHTVGAGIETVRSRLRYAFRALRRSLGTSA
jgi:RNA polymerase sigma-70 factor (ECF subfamily)